MISTGEKSKQATKAGTIENILVVQARTIVSWNVVVAELKIIGQILEILRKEECIKLALLKVQCRAWMIARVKEWNQEFGLKWLEKKLFTFSETGNTRGEAGLRWIKRNVQLRAC